MADLVATKRGPGRPRKGFDPSQRFEILRLIHEGHGRGTACLMMRLSSKRFARQLREDPGFADEVRLAEASRVETCELLLFQIVGGHGDTALKMRAAVAYLGRRDRVDAARRGRAAARRSKSEHG